MKKLTYLFWAVIFSAGAFAQINPYPQLPEFFNYQGVARNTAGQPLANQTIKVTAAIISPQFGLLGAVQLYSERRSVTTNQFGLFSIQIGSPGAESTFGNFTTLYLGLTRNANFNLRVQIELPGNPIPVSLGDTKLASVPYSLVAKIARPWLYTLSEPDGTNRTIYPDKDYWNLGLGTAEATEKLHVVGKIRMVDGSQGAGKVLMSDANGAATWQTLNIPPELWKRNGTNIYPTTITDRIGIGTNTPGALLHVNGTFRLTDGTQSTGDVLTTDNAGNASWNSFEQNPQSYWTKYVDPVNGNTVTNKSDIIQLKLTPFRTYIVPSGMPSGPVNDYRSYPFGLYGGTRGMFISLQGVADKSKKYITFFDGNNNVKGMIEGQTVADLQNDPQYIAYIVIQTLSAGSFIAEGIACGFQVDLFEVAVQSAQAAIWGADLGVQIDRLESNAGIAYQSGSGDYAEWLERADNAEIFSFGDIVCAKGGKITKNTSGGGQLMVISKSPIVLGNMPDKGKEAAYEKVAFMGQVPVKVTGKVAVGDYIIASGNNNGIGYAINPSKISPAEYRRIVGVAWSASGEGAISMINTAVGINTHAATDMLQKQEEEMTVLKSQLNQMGAYLQTKDPSFKFSPLDVKTALNDEKKNESTNANSPSLNKAQENTKIAFAQMKPEERMKYINQATAEKLKKLIDEDSPYLRESWKAVKEKIEANNKELNKNPKLQKLITDYDFFISILKQIYKLG